jgi:hypothetical protein
MPVRIGGGRSEGTDCCDQVQVVRTWALVACLPDEAASIMEASEWITRIDSLVKEMMEEGFYFNGDDYGGVNLHHLESNSWIAYWDHGKLHLP